MDYSKIWEATEKLYHRTQSIGNSRHGSVYWGDKLIRYFESEPAVTFVTIPVVINVLGFPKGEADVYRDGRLVMRIIH